MVFFPNQTITHPTGVREPVKAEHRKHRKVEPRGLIVSHADHERLSAILESARRDAHVRESQLAALEREINLAQRVPSDEVPADVITMDSVVRLRDLDSGETDEFELVYPAHADMEQNRISVLAPIGTAILGYRVGDVIEWPVPAGMRRFRVEEMLFQPERASAAMG